MKVRIYTMTHKHFLDPEDKDLYIPLHVGRALGNDLGYLGDHTGENISACNDRYGELTGVYWVWKNDVDSDIIGICHYRRFFADENRNLLQQKDYENILQEYDVIVSPGMQDDKPYLQIYGEAHNIEDLYAVGRAIKKRFPEDYPVFERVIYLSKSYYGNLMVTRRELFMDYAKWLFAIFEEAEKEIDVTAYNLYNRRVFGFLSEQLLMAWIVKNNLKAYECPIRMTAEKAETVELKLAVAQLIKQGKVSQARELFYELMKVRPDVRLELSDVKGEIPVIEHLLYIMEEEEKREIQGALSYSNHLPDLIAHYRKTAEILKACGEHPLSFEQETYCLKSSVSWVMVMVVLLNNPKLLEEKQKILGHMRQFYKKNGKTADEIALEEAQAS